MKKANLFMYSFLVLFIVSCAKESDDTTDIVGDDLIIGVWKPIKDVWNDNGVEVVSLPNPCYQKSRLTFEGNKNLKVKYFNDYEDDVNCIDYSHLFVSGSWEKISEGSYKITNTYFDEDTNKNETEIETIRILFPTPNTMNFFYNATDYEEYSRVQ